MDRARAAVVTGVERGQQVAHLTAAHLADDQPVGAHPQGLADEVAQRDPAGALDVGRPGDQPHDVRVARPQLLGVLDADHPLPRIDSREQRGEDRGLAAAGAPGHDEREPGGEHRPQQRLAGGVEAAERAQRREVVGCRA